MIYPDQLDIRIFDSKKLGQVESGVFASWFGLAKTHWGFAFETQNNFIDLTTKVINGQLEWMATKATTSYFLSLKTKQGKKLKEPPREGWVFDHFSWQALENYLKDFSSAFKNINGKIRSVFNDSYEVYKANYTPGFFETFKNNRGYDLKPYTNRLFDRNNNEISNRIRSDYRETLSDLMIDGFNPLWNTWAQNKGVKLNIRLMVLQKLN